MRFNLLGYILGDNFFQVRVILINLLYSMIQKRYQVGGIANAHNYARPLLRVLQSRSNTKSCLIHDFLTRYLVFVLTNSYGLNSTKSATFTVTDVTFPFAT